MINHLIKGIRLNQHDQIFQFDVDLEKWSSIDKKSGPRSTTRKAGVNHFFSILIIFIFLLIFYDFLSINC